MNRRQPRRILLPVALLFFSVLVAGPAVARVVSEAAGGSGALRAAVARAAPETYTITPTAGRHGTIAPSTPQTVPFGGSALFVITPDKNFQVADVLVDGVSVGAVSSYTFENVVADHTISAAFTPVTYTITPAAGPNGSISPGTPQEVENEGSVTFAIAPDPGYRVADVLVDGASVGAVASYTFVNVTADHTISATFAIDSFVITPAAGPNGSISPSSPQTVAYGAGQTFTITPDLGYHVADVLVDGASVGAVTSYTFENVTDDHTIGASFAAGAQTALRIAPGAPVVAYGDSTVLRGELVDASGGTGAVGLGGRSVTVEQAATALGPWEPLGAYTTSPLAEDLGQFSLPVTPGAPTYYRLRYQAEPASGYWSSLSPVVKVGVRPLLERPVAPTTVRAGRAFTVRGSLRPQFPAGEKNVIVKVYRSRNGRWTPVKTAAATNVDADGSTTYRLKTRLRARGTYRFRATFTAPGWTGVTTAFSRRLVVR